MIILKYFVTVVRSPDILPELGWSTKGGLNLSIRENDDLEYNRVTGESAKTKHRENIWSKMPLSRPGPGSRCLPSQMNALCKKIRSSNPRRGGSLPKQSTPGFLSLICCFPWRAGEGRLLTSACGVSVAQSCQTPCDPIDYTPLGSSVHGIFHARILEWVAISSSRASSWARDQTPVSWSPVSPALQVDSLPLSHQGQHVVVSPTSMEGNSCCATRKAFLSVPSGLLEVLVIWPALSDHCTLPPGTSEKKEGFGFDWDRLNNIINGGREDNYPINKRHGGDRHIQNQAWLWNKSDSRRVVIYLFISLRFPHLLSLSLIWADSPYPNFPLCPRSAMAASGTISSPTVHSSHCRKPPILFLPPFGMLISLSYLIGTLILEISLQRYWIPAYEMQNNRI